MSNTKQDAIVPLDDRYANQIIGTDPHRFDMVEIHGVSPVGELGTSQHCVEVDYENPEFFSV